MAVFHPIPNAAKLTVRFTGPQLQTWTIGSYWSLVTPAPFTPLEVKGLADQGDVEFMTELLAGFVLPQVRYEGCEARALDTISSPSHFSNANAGPGGHTQVMLPAEVAAVTTFASGTPGRSFRNRWYWPGIEADSLDIAPGDGVFSSAFVGNMQTAFNSFLAATAGTTFKHVVASPKLGTFVDVTSVTVKRRPASQRRREA